MGPRTKWAPTSFEIPGYNVPDAAPANANGNDRQRPAAPYSIPPAVWMVVFLVVGYMGVRFLMEEA